MEAEKAFQNVWTLSEEKHKKSEITAQKNRALKIDDLNNKNKKLKKFANDTLTKLNDANDTIHILKQLLTQEKMKIDKLSTELKPTKQPEPLKHPLCTVLKEEVKAKENALEKIGEMNHQIQKIETERDEIKKVNRDMKAKILDIIQIKNELVEQNKTLISQRDKFQCLLNDKDKLIQKLSLANMEVLKNPLVLDHTRSLEKNHEAEKTKCKEELKLLNKNLVEACNNNRAQTDTIKQQHDQLMKICRQYEALKREHDMWAEKMNAAVFKKENDVLALIETTKHCKTDLIKEKNTNVKKDQEIATLKEELRVKNIEIQVLSKTKELYSEKITKLTNQLQSFLKIINHFHKLMVRLRLSLKYLQHSTYAVQRQLQETNENLYEEEENGLIKEKILEESRETVKMLRSRLEQFFCQLQMCKREKEILLLERVCCF
ncbi:hypothetical protein WDU94_014448 [Cyamophila willieti]